MSDFTILSSHEVGSAITYIEWVARSGKPICEAGARRLIDAEQVDQLVSDLERCVALSGESVGAFLYEQTPKVWSFGFYSKPWALEVLLFLVREGHRLGAMHREVLFGLLFGYTADSIDCFLVRSGIPVPTLQDLCGRCTVETVPLPTGRSGSRSRRSARCPTAGTHAQWSQS